MRIEQRVLRIPWVRKRRKASVRKEMKVPEDWLPDYVVDQKLMFLGHVKRHQGLEKIILEWKIDDKRRRERPPRGWSDDVKERLGSIEQAGRMAKDRTMSRAAVRAAKAGCG